MKDGNYCLEAKQRMYYRERTGKGAEHLDYTMDNLKTAMYELVSQSAETAAVKVTMRSPIRNGSDADMAYIDLLVEFSRDNNKWIISGGDFIEVLDYYYAPKEDNVKTGDCAIMSYLISLVFAASCIILIKRGNRGLVRKSISG